MYSVNARRKDPCPTKIIFVRHSSLIERTTRSANAFRFGDNGVAEPIFQHLILGLEKFDDEQLTPMHPARHNGQEKRQQWRHGSHTDSLPQASLEFLDTTASDSSELPLAR